MWAICFFTDDAWFHSSGYINSQNSSIWSADNTNALQENPVHWCSVRRVGNTNCGKDFFGGTISVENYRNVLTAGTE